MQHIETEVKNFTKNLKKLKLAAEKLGLEKDYILLSPFILNDIE